jgi:hypothetical protein
MIAMRAGIASQRMATSNSFLLTKPLQKWNGSTTNQNNTLFALHAVAS